MLKCDFNKVAKQLYLIFRDWGLLFQNRTLNKENFTNVLHVPML